MIKVAVFVKNLESGGAEKQAVLLANLLSGDLASHFIVFNGGRLHQKYVDMLSQGNATVHIINGSFASRFKKLRSLIKEEQFDIIFSYLTAANAFASLACFGLKTKVVAGLRNSRLPLLKHIADCVTTNYLADKAVANCYSGKDHFASHGFKGSKIEVIPNCFDGIKPYRPKSAAENVNVVSVGRFTEQKDYETAIRAIAVAKTKCPSLRYTIIGYGSLEADIRRWVEQHGIADITTILINPGDIPQRLAKADIFLLTSTFEGTSNAIMEALNADLPVVATNVGDNYRMVENGRNGYLAEIGDVAGLADHIEKIAESAEIRAKMGQESKQILINRFSEEEFRSSYINLINSLTAK